MNQLSNYRIILALSGLLAIVCLFSPFVWMEVGPLGHRYYGLKVPDVYIYGGAITGKDKSFWGIAFAENFQLFFNLMFIVLSFIAFFLRKKHVAIISLIFQLLLLVLFPTWLDGYISGVVGNSDAADLTIHKQYGMVIYWVLVGLNILGLILVLLSSKDCKEDLGECENENLEKKKRCKHLRIYTFSF